MIININVSKMIVFSDLHLGNPFSKQKKEILRFIKWATREGYDICINGDGLEIAQVSLSKIARDIPEIVRGLREHVRSGRHVYYVVGNHDLALEHFLEDWGALKVSPFLNVWSGDKRIRVEHGHLYDPFFVKYPLLYTVLTHVGGYFVKTYPALYRLWIWFERTKARFRARKTGILGEPEQFAAAAQELAFRGFDYVILGHTHHAGETPLLGGATYFNPGSWMIDPHFVEINEGQVRLVQWKQQEALSASARA